ncbi:uncharacterized protein LOC141911288 [Tubulanus polymorphus]|uniref:uncharacterized protein LOC141911288 n=1 Tax=Tubulanus polymorphus TaxID=672921 RepID=UPI003DA2EBC4
MYFYEVYCVVKLFAAPAMYQLLDVPIERVLKVPVIHYFLKKLSRYLIFTLVFVVTLMDFTLTRGLDTTVVVNLNVTSKLSTKKQKLVDETGLKPLSCRKYMCFAEAFDDEEYGSGSWPDVELWQEVRIPCPLGGTTNSSMVTRQCVVDDEQGTIWGRMKFVNCRRTPLAYRISDILADLAISRATPMNRSAEVLSRAITEVWSICTTCGITPFISHSIDKILTRVGFNTKFKVTELSDGEKLTEIVSMLLESPTETLAYKIDPAIHTFARTSDFLAFKYPKLVQLTSGDVINVMESQFLRIVATKSNRAENTSLSDEKQPANIKPMKGKKKEWRKVIFDSNKDPDRRLYRRFCTRNGLVDEIDPVTGSKWNVSAACRQIEVLSDGRTTCICDFSAFLPQPGTHGQGVKIRNAGITFWRFRSIAELARVQMTLACFSFVCLLCTAVTLLSFKRYRQERTKLILVNLCFALMFFYVIFLFASFLSDVHLCPVSSAMRLYIILVSLSWNFVEAFNMYLTLVKVLSKPITAFVRKAAIFAWGVPLLIVFIPFAVDINIYQGEWIDCQFLCRMKVQPMVFLFVIPMTVIVCCNSVVFILVLRVLYQRTKTDRRGHMQQLRGAVAVMALLGIPWVLSVFGLLPSEQNGFIDAVQLFCQICFVLFLSAQGAFIFFFHCARMPDVRQNWAHLLTSSRLCQSLRATSNDSLSTLQTVLDGPTKWNQRPENSSSRKTSRDTTDTDCVHLEETSDLGGAAAHLSNSKQQQVEHSNDNTMNLPRVKNVEMTLN